MTFLSFFFIFPWHAASDTHRRWALGAFEHRRAGHQRFMQTVVVVWALKRVQNSRSSWSLGCYMNLCYISHLKNGVQRQAGYVLIRKKNEWKTADSWKYQQLGVVNILFGYTLLHLINNRSGYLPFLVCYLNMFWCNFYQVINALN